MRITPATTYFGGIAEARTMQRLLVAEYSRLEAMPEPGDAIGVAKRTAEMRRLKDLYEAFKTQPDADVARFIIVRED